MPDMMSSLSKPLVLLVEDEAPLVTMLRYNLEKQGFRVDEATDGQEALTRITELQPDLVLLDWMLPIVSGIEVCRQIRRRPATRDLPVIMLTARTEDQDAIRALNTGADDYITKPFNVCASWRSSLNRGGRSRTTQRSILPPRSSICLRC
jgi:two-component system phosphate regulon response regulator PhoB